MSGLEVQRRRSGEPGHDWAGLLDADSRALLFSSPRWFEFLLEYMPGARCESLVCLDRGRLAGALPMIVTDGPAGPLANSLPFFGSNCAFVVDASHPAPNQVRAALWQAWLEREAQIGCAATVLVDTPYRASASFLRAQAWDYLEPRMGHMTPLGGLDGPDAAEALMDRIHSKARNMVRKAWKFGVEVRPAAGPEDLDFVQQTHQDNIGALGGVVKPRAFFDLARQRLDTDTWLALLDGRRAAGLFLVRHNRVAEYFTPVLRPEARPSQPLSALIFAAMLDQAARGALWWNWGSTWTDQEGLALFKDRWGAVSGRFHYYGRLPHGAAPWRELGRAGILEHYAGFYALPFSMLERGA